MLAGSLVNDRYEVDALLGTGGMADVFRAHDVVLDRDVALKVVRSPDADRGRFEREIQLLARLQHPHIVRLLDGGELDGVAFLALELVRGPSLADRLVSGPLPPDEVAALGTALAEALAYLHAKGVVHRDIKPSNVLLTDDDRVVLGDLGIAQMHDAAALTATGFTIGTAAYLAPEQLHGSTVGPDADVYALGLVLAECPTGRRVFEGGPDEAALARLARDPDFSDVPDPAWRSLLSEMTERDPNARVTAADAVARLTRVAARDDGATATAVMAAPTATTAAVPVVAPVVGPAPTVTPPTTPARRHRDRVLVRRLLVACIVVPLVLLALAALAVDGADTGELTPPAVAPSTTAPPATTASTGPTTTALPPTTTVAPATAPAENKPAKPGDNKQTDDKRGGPGRH